MTLVVSSVRKVVGFVLFQVTLLGLGMKDEVVKSLLEIYFLVL